MKRILLARLKMLQSKKIKWIFGLIYFACILFTTSPILGGVNEEAALIWTINGMCSFIFLNQMMYKADYGNQNTIKYIDYNYCGGLLTETKEQEALVHIIYSNAFFLAYLLLPLIFAIPAFLLGGGISDNFKIFMCALLAMIAFVCAFTSFVDTLVSYVILSGLIGGCFGFSFAMFSNEENLVLKCEGPCYWIVIAASFLLMNLLCLVKYFLCVQKRSVT